ncbi:hypothetical protein [Dokdonella sp.]|uniref:hypothetical protein n=1 Tax=Dokdonella sp. TaxID=2291710 RepID=UPI0025B82854|nr:hypothetical protein [Dokdonella sp.]
MMKMLTLACAVALGLSLSAAAPLAQAQDTHSTTAAASAAATVAAPKLHAAMRALWRGHIDNTRAYALAVKAGDKAAEAKAADATVANAKEIANAVAGFYGEAAGKGMLELLAGHWSGVKAMTDAAKAGATAAHDKAMQDLTANADAIAKFLAGANPNLTEEGVRGLMIMHIGDHEAQISQIMRGDAKGEATTWTHMQAHMNTLADALSDAIAKQFPAKAE